MKSAYIFVEASGEEVYDGLCKCPGVQTVDKVTGEGDYIIRAQGHNLSDIDEIKDEVQKVPGIRRTDTYISLKNTLLLDSEVVARDPFWTYAYVLIETHVRTTAQVAKELKEISGILAVDMTMGPQDIITLVKAPGLAQLGNLVTAQNTHASGK